VYRSPGDRLRSAGLVGSGRVGSEHLLAGPARSDAKAAVLSGHVRRMAWSLAAAANVEIKTHTKQRNSNDPSALPERVLTGDRGQRC